MNTSVLCFGLTPVLQRTLVFEALETNEVNRAKQVVESAAGKALNTARALSVLGTPAQVAGFNGGVAGRKIEAFLKTYGVVSAQTLMRAETRICTTLIDRTNNTVTELVEEAPYPDKAAIARFERANLKRAKESSMLVISGTLPPFASDDFYVRFVQAATAANVPVVIDSHKAALIHVLFERPYVAKLNVRELEATLQIALKTEREIFRAMKDLVGMGAQNVFVTHGANAAYLLTTDGKAWRFQPPDAQPRVNPIGSGDCTTAGLVHALLRKKPLTDAVALGLACGSANIISLTPADFKATYAHGLVGKVNIKAKK
ncbi:MAG: PfkB family carbohydrate kinase [Kiritimatiellaeota bacterium]|nr:PfkB family carbohydrate kinase [Kiritimatiellota bacterium]